MEIWKVTPAYKDYLWGGTKIKEIYNAKWNTTTIAESWVLSAHTDGINYIENGRFKDRVLSDLLCDKKYWGKNGSKFDTFPVLIKIIDANKKLSVQVHPSDELGMKMEGQNGKTEVWYILDAEKDAYVYYGLKEDITEAELRKVLNSNKLTEILNKVYVETGDVIMVEAGTIHAIGSGVLLAEIQQNSNVTYRLFDYDRLDATGQKRPLHIEKGIMSSSLKKTLVNVKPIKQELKGGNVKIHIGSTDYFKSYCYKVASKVELQVTENSFVSVVILQGEFEIQSMKVHAGESIFVPASDGKISFLGKGEILITHI